jgi:hypothetical protein
MSRVRSWDAPHTATPKLKDREPRALKSASWYNIKTAGNRHPRLTDGVTYEVTVRHA